MLLAYLEGLIDLLTGSVWTYPLLLGICAGDALIPAFPSETALIGMGADRLELAHAVSLVVPAEDVGGEGPVRRFEHAVQVCAVGPGTHDVPVALFGDA